MKKYKILTKLSLALIGFGALASIPLAMTSCGSGGGPGKDVYGILGCKISNWDLNNKTVAQWTNTNGMKVADFDATINLPNGWQEFNVLAVGKMYKNFIEQSWTITFGEYPVIVPNKMTTSFYASTSAIQTGTYSLRIEFKYAFYVIDNVVYDLISPSSLVPGYYFSSITVAA